MTVQWYYRRIRKLIVELKKASSAALPANRSIVTKFLSCNSLYAVVNILSGLRRVNEWDEFDWDNHSTLSKFKTFIVDNETHMERSLRSVQYCIDETNTLTMVAGPGRPEKVSHVIFVALIRVNVSP